MKRDIQNPFNDRVKFSNLEELRRAVSDMEETARLMGVYPTEVCFAGDFVLGIYSESLSDKSLVLNATITISTREDLHVRIAGVEDSSPNSCA